MPAFADGRILGGGWGGREMQVSEVLIFWPGLQRPGLQVSGAVECGLLTPLDASDLKTQTA
jgi:hypothetical protein